MHLSRGRLLLACLLMVTTIDSASAVCAYVCATRGEATSRANAPASHTCHEPATAPADGGSLVPTPDQCSPEPPALTTARHDAPAFGRSAVLGHAVEIVGGDDARSLSYHLETNGSAQPGAPPGAPLPLRI
jgi:hypothetical protein